MNICKSKNSPELAALCGNLYKSKHGGLYLLCRVTRDKVGASIYQLFDITTGNRWSDKFTTESDLLNFENVTHKYCLQEI